jgi:hypothetical protein
VGKIAQKFEVRASLVPFQGDISNWISAIAMVPPKRHQPINAGIIFFYWWFI